MNINLPPAENESVSPGLESYVPTFWGDRWKEMGQLRDYVSQEDLNSARGIAHNWKGFCEPYGFAGLGILSKALEEASDSGDMATCEHILNQMEAYLIAKKNHLDL